MLPCYLSYKYENLLCTKQNCSIIAYNFSMKYYFRYLCGCTYLFFIILLIKAFGNFAIISKIFIYLMYNFITCYKLFSIYYKCCKSRNFTIHIVCNYFING